MIRFTACLMVLCAAAQALADSSATAALAPDRLPAWIIQLPASINDVLIADTSSATMHRFSRNGGRLEWADERYMSIGQNGPGKQRAWDKRTPLGTYFITERLDTARLHDKYGVAAFPLDYPNAWDRNQQRTGYGIWLHGVDHNNPNRPPRDTDGCLAIGNEALLKIADDLVPLQTPVIVADRMRWVDEQQIGTIRAEFHLVLAKWQQSLQEGDLLSYLSLYSDDFRYLGMDKAHWSAFRLQALGDGGQGLEISDVMLFADPAEPDLYLSRFTQQVSREHGAIRTIKRLYWRRQPGHRWQIVSEDNG